MAKNICLPVRARRQAEHWEAFTGYYIDKRGRRPPDHWYENVAYFDTRKLRKIWQYHVVMGLKKAVRGSKNQKHWNTTLGSTFKKYPSGFDCDCMPGRGAVERLIVYLCKYVSQTSVNGDLSRK